MQLDHLLNGDTFNISVNNETVDEEDVAPSKNLENGNTEVKPSIPTEKTGDNMPGPLDNGDAVITVLNQNQDDISEITGASNVGKARQSTIKPMEGIPEHSKNGDCDEGTESTFCSNTTHLPSKNCSSCGNEKNQEYFSPSQWKKTRGTGRCIGCVSGCPQWQTSNMTSATLQPKLCCACKGQKKHADFSTSQWKRPVGTGRCRDCVMNERM